MSISELQQAISDHSGVFHCAPRGEGSATKQINFAHLYDPPGSFSTVPDVGKLKEFYSTFGNVTLYHHIGSGDAAFYLASPDQWEALRGCFLEWTEVLDEEEREELVPEWVDDCIVIGEIPASGNYLLLPTRGDVEGHVFEFEHDGFEFIDRASNVCEFVTKMLSPDSRTLTNMASHLTFIEGDPMEQWWIEEMRDNKGHVVKTET